MLNVHDIIMVIFASQNVVMLKNNSRIESIKKEMDSIQEEGAKQEGNSTSCAYY